MAFEFKLPDIGEGVHEGEIAKWLVAEGAILKEDAPMVEVMTDKVTVEITAPVSGTVLRQLYKEGDTVKVGSVMIEIDTDEGPAVKSAESNGQGAKEIQQEKTLEPLQTAFSQQGAIATPMKSMATSGKALAAPAVRKMARTMGMDLSQIMGTGPRGRVQKTDLMTLGGNGQSTAPKRSVLREEKRIPFIGMRRKIGEHLVHAKQMAPHFTYVEEADMSRLVALRDDLLPVAQDHAVKLSYLPFIIKAVISGLQAFPKLNSTLDEGTQEIILKPYYHIGVAVAMEDGLMVPVIRDADRKSLFQLAQEIKTLSEKARTKKLGMADLQGGTFTLTSIGSIGGMFSAPIINYPEVAIMGIHKIEKRPVVRNDQIVIRDMTYFSISGDHRVVDGAEVALFMKHVIEVLEHPGRLMGDFV